MAGSLAASSGVQQPEPVTITVSESIAVFDSPQGVPPEDVPISESIGITDTPGVFPPESVPVTEAITVTDTPEIVLGTAPVVITVFETITVTDTPGSVLGLAPVVITVLEPIAVTDTVEVRPSLLVTTTSDTDGGICDPSHCSLRQAINLANASPGFDVIEFRIPNTDPGRDALTGIFTIRPGSSLPLIDDPVSIDGYTQPGASPNTLASGNDAVLLIELDGSLAGSFANGLNLVGSTTLRGLVINRFGGDAVRIWGGDGHVVQGNFIGTDPTGTLDLGNGTGIRFIGSSRNGSFGGTTPEARNLISGNNGAAVIIQGVGSTGNLVQGNYIGTDASGTSALGNGGGVSVLSGGNTVGGATPGARNLVSGNSGDGLLVSGSDNLVQGNYIGTDVTGGSALGNGATGLSLFGSNNVIGGTADGGRNIISANHTGVFVSTGRGNVVLGNHIGTDVTGTIALGNATEGVSTRAPDTIIGGTANGAGNLISGNGVHGVLVTDATSAGSRVEGNLIGTQADGVSPLGNGLQGFGIGGLSVPTDVAVGGTSDGQGNTIAFNGSDGVGVGSGTGIPILGNSMFSNADLGIDLGNNGVTLNDLRDADASPNLLQNFPVLSSAIVRTSNIEGTLNSMPDTRFHIEFFSNTSCDPSGYGEGESFIGSTAVTTDAGGDASIVAVLPAGVLAGRFLTATATDPGNNTSEFSRCVTVTQEPEADLSVTKSDSPDPVFVGQRVTYTIDVTNGGPQEATGVTLTDTLPVGMSFNSASAGCVEALGVVTCNLGTLASGAVASVQIIIIADAVGTLTNTATASSDQLDPNTANDTATENTAVVPTTDLRTTKTDSSDPATAGENLTYTVTVTNDGPQDATDATLTDTLPSDVSFVSASAGCTESGGTVTCALGTIALGASAVVEIVVSPTTPGTITNVADASSDVLDPDPANNRGAESTTVVPATSFTVNTTDNQDDGACDANHCSLKEAIKAANANVDQDFIHFNIPTTAPGYDATTGVYTIAAATFPLIERGGVTIDGYTQPGASPNTLTVGNNAVLVIELAGTGGFSSGLTIGGGSFTPDGPVTIRGLVINRFGGDGIRIWEGSGHVIEGNFIGTYPTGTLDLGNGIGIAIFRSSSNNTFGGTTPAARNVISGNGGGIAIKSGTDNVIQGNYIGTDASGTTALANSSYGVSVTASGNTVGGARLGASCTGPCNVISSSFGYGVQLSASDNVVQGNFIGTDVTGTVALKNSLTGVDVAGTRMTIGGSGDGEGNIISGNGWGVNIRAGDSHVVRGNYIGTDVTGTLDLGNTNYGIGIAGSNNIIGGTADGARNVISGNNGQGILLSGSGAFGNRSEGNFIGTQADGLSPLGNTLDGVRIIGFTPKDNSIGGTGDGQGNTFAFNGRAGVFVNNGAGHFILGNTIFSNTGLGIDLAPTGVTANDAGDPDSGLNLLQNFPVLSSATAGSTVIDGTLNSTANTRFWIDLFSSTNCDPTGNGEGQVFLGSTVVTTDSSGNGGFTVTLTTIVPIGHFITATATDPGKNTSEFSPCVEVAAPTVADLGIDKTDSTDPVALGQTLTYSITITNAGPDEATGVVLTDDLPLDMSFVSASAGCTAAGRTVTCTVGAIPGAGNVVIQIVVLASATGTQINVAHVTADNDLNDGNNFATENTEVVVLADLSITKVDDRDPVTAGESLTYTLTVTNSGPNDATGVILNDTLPQGMTFASVTSTQGTCVHAGAVICDLGTLIAPAVEPPPDPEAIFLPATDVLAQFEFNGDVTDSSGGGRDAVLLGGEFMPAPWGQGLHVFFGGPTGID